MTNLCYNQANKKAPTGVIAPSEHGRFNQRLRRIEPTWKAYHKRNVSDVLRAFRQRWNISVKSVKGLKRGVSSAVENGHPITTPERIRGNAQNVRALLFPVEVAVPYVWETKRRQHAREVLKEYEIGRLAEVVLGVPGWRSKGMCTVKIVGRKITAGRQFAGKSRKITEYAPNAKAQQFKDKLSVLTVFLRRWYIERLRRYKGWHKGCAPNAEDCRTLTGETTAPNVKPTQIVTMALRGGLFSTRTVACVRVAERLQFNFSRLTTLTTTGRKSVESMAQTQQGVLLNWAFPILSRFFVLIATALKVFTDRVRTRGRHLEWRAV